MLQFLSVIENRKTRGTLEASVRNYLKMHMDTYSLLKSGAANISKLSRDIKDEIPDLSIAGIRYALNKIMNESTGTASDLKRVDKLLSQSKITLQDKITVITSKVPLQLNYISATYLTDSIVYIVDETKEGRHLRDDQVVAERDVSLVHIFSSKEIEKVPGFVMRISERLFSSGINVLQLISCANETIIVIRKGDGIRAYESLVS